MAATNLDVGAPVAVIGAGISGLVCARNLAAHGFDVLVIEKSRGVGGRMATRRAGPLQFDHGAQYFTVRDPQFRKAVADWIKEGVAERWHGRVRVLRRGVLTDTEGETKRFVGCPAMNRVCRYLANGICIQLRSHVTGLHRREGGWQLQLAQYDTALANFQCVIISAPAFQSAQLLANHSPLTKAIRDVPMQPCWSVMVQLESPLTLDCDAAFVHESPLAWIAKNSSKPGRSARPETWVLHASSEWSAEHLEESAVDVKSALLQALADATGCQANVVHSAAHRWRFALPSAPLQQPFLFDEVNALGVCGDWCGGPRVEGAYLSGLALANRLIEL